MPLKKQLARKYSAKGTAAPEPTKDGIRSLDEQMASQDAESTEGLAGTLAAGAEGVIGAIPGGKWAQGKILSAAGVPEQYTAGKQAQLEAEHPVASTVGLIGGAVAGGGALGGAAKGASLAAKVATTAGQAAMLAPAYKMGELANQAQLQGDALHVEQIGHAFDFSDILQASGLAALFHLPAAGLEAVVGLSGAAGKGAVKQAGGLFSKAAAKLGITEEQAGQLALDQGMLEKTGSTKRLLQASGKQIASAVKEAQIDAEFQERAATKLIGLYKDTEHVSALGTARKFLQDQTRRLIKGELDGTQVEDIVQSLNNEAKAAFKADKPGKGQLLGDAAQLLRSELGEHLNIVHPEAGAKYRGAISDYRTYSVMLSEAERGVAKQASAGTVAGAVGRVGVAHVVGSAVGGPAGAVIADVAAGAMGLKKLGSKNYAVLLNKISKNGPSAAFEEKAAKSLERLMSPSAVLASEVASDDINTTYEQYSRALKNSIADPDGTAQKLRAQVNFLPPHIADAFVANQMNKLQCTTMDLPVEHGPATAFGIVPAVSDRQKREFLRKTRAKFDPFYAIESGRQDLIQEAEKFNPETMHELKGRVIKDLSSRENVPYLTKRRVSGILGVAGTPTQDPALGYQLQQIMQAKKQADSAVGQMGSARQMNANLKRDSATLTRAQGILNSKD